MIEEQSVSYTSRPKLSEVTLRYSTGLIAGILLTSVLIIAQIPPPLLDSLLPLYILFFIYIACFSFFVKPSCSLYSENIFLWTFLGLPLMITSLRMILLDGNSGAKGTGHFIVAIAQIATGGDIVVDLILIILSIWMCVRTIMDQSFIIKTIDYFFTEEGPADIAEISPEGEAIFYSKLKKSLKYFRGLAIAIPVVFFISLPGGILMGVIRHGMCYRDALIQYSTLSVGMLVIFAFLNFIISVILKSSFSVCLPENYYQNFKGTFEKMSVYFIIIAIISLLLAFLGLTGILPFPVIPFLLIFVLFLILKSVTGYRRNKKGFIL